MQKIVRGGVWMDFIKKPMEIENRSMEIIAPHLTQLRLTPEQTKVYSRIIHAAGDVEYAPIIKMSDDAIEKGIAALRLIRENSALLAARFIAVWPTLRLQQRQKKQASRAPCRRCAPSARHWTATL